MIIIQALVARAELLLTDDEIKYKECRDRCAMRRPLPPLPPAIPIGDHAEPVAACRACERRAYLATHQLYTLSEDEYKYSSARLDAFRNLSWLKAHKNENNSAEYFSYFQQYLRNLDELQYQGRHIERDRASFDAEMNRLAECNDTQSCKESCTVTPPTTAPAEEEPKAGCPVCEEAALEVKALRAQVATNKANLGLLALHRAEIVHLGLERPWTDKENAEIADFDKALRAMSEKITKLEKQLAAARAALDACNQEHPSASCQPPMQEIEREEMTPNGASVPEAPNGTGGAGAPPATSPSGPPPVPAQVPQAETKPLSAGGIAGSGTGIKQPERSPVRFVVGAAVGESFNRTASCAGNTQTLTTIGLSMVNCTTKTNDIAYALDVQFRFLRYYGLSFGYLNNGTVKQNAIGTLPGVSGVSGTITGHFGPVNGLTLQGLAVLPFTDNWALTLGVGGQAWDVHSDSRFVLIAPPSPNTTSAVSQTNSKVSLIASATIEYWVTPCFALDARYVYTQYKDGSMVNETYDTVFIGAEFSLGRKVSHH